MDLYDDFVEAVAEGRSMEPDQVREIAQGRIYTGLGGMRHGLVDEIGRKQPGMMTLIGVAITVAYVYSAAQNLPVAHHDFEIDIDGRRLRERAAAVHVANFGTRVGPFVLPPKADGRDGELDVVIMRAQSLEETINLLATPLMPDQSLNKAVRNERGRRVQVKASKDLPVQVDGEDRGDHPGLHCRIEPESLPVIVPR